ncbi:MULTISPECIES: tripartite tricarboxylate transporter substrate binding protein [Achromobacter]|jgi:tripartite-type tricarboxylate transporter receptor subunit TctC|uniref:Tripartite tricarboxylate transporter substrate binding protein n=1 Tax=Alcaligenes xylosoxydans xylosoxydans TaxID=85698 RepID=A0A424WJ91_ALCXX|nr:MULTISPECIES: tripartite tricarboxylate transporter substrate binding protein [Achromobacter]MBC9904655.1 tripartite tricarboxylate transporter substrate binding protein [Achromobacter xylosoxidans]MBD0868197.1 tripartite tricarboxylate transporter substrate binding protein [Achromobacter xylosoxidans]MDH1301826.1 tripartite tricarboxylate transporter substrate binding protein [Achromobacter sp. GD03932]QNP85427.1 tripartite tricarboxylate transporter substrate binding protein [Achromobacter
MRKTILASAGACLFAFSALAGAQGYPARAISMVVPYAPGGSTDGLARIVAQAMGENLGQPVVVENQGGGGTMIGNQRVARAAPDGYTITFGNMGSLAIAPSLYPASKFDPRRDMTAIGLVATVPMVLSVSKASGITKLSDFVERLRKQGKDVNFGNAGSGSTSHIAAAYFLHVTGTQGMQIPYRGAGPAISDLMAGTVEAVIDQTVTMIPIHEGKRVTALAVASPSRLPQIPDVPTFAEGGVPQFNMSVWNGIAAPAGTPPAVVARLEEALAAALKSPNVRESLDKLAAQAPGTQEQGSAAFQALIARDVPRFAELIRDAGITVN